MEYRTFYCLQLTLMLLLFCCKDLDHSQDNQLSSSTELSLQSINKVISGSSNATVEYRCPPCGCPSDHLLFFEKEKCNTCDMRLVALTKGNLKVVDKTITPIIRGVKFYNLYSKLIYPIIVISILLSIFLLFNISRYQSPNIFLVLIILVLSLFAFHNQLYDTRNGHTSHWRSLFTPISFILSIGPLIFFYVKKLVSNSFEWRKWYWFHFLPALLMFCFYGVTLFSSHSFQVQFMSSPHGTTFSKYEQLASLIGGSIYLLSAWIVFKDWKNNTSNSNNWLASWLIRFFKGLSLLLITWAGMLFVDFWLYDFGLVTINYNPLWYAIAGVLIWLNVEILLHPKFFLIKGYVSKYKEPAILTDEKITQYRLNLILLMEEQKIYKNSDLSLDKLANMMQINPRYLSVILNDSLGKSFYDFINYYRVEEVKNFLKNHAHEKFTIEAIANKSGFNSKSSFNLAFKKYTRMTPREFINEDL